MFARFCFLPAFAALALAGCRPSGSSESAPALGPVVVVKTCYDGGGSHIVESAVAWPIESKLTGADGLVRIESECTDEGNYTARAYFTAKTDPKVALTEVQRRVAVAKLSLPPLAQEQVTVEAGQLEADPNKVAIAVSDPHNHGLEKLEAATAAVEKRLVAEGAIDKPQSFPQAEARTRLRIDFEKRKNLGIDNLELVKAFGAAGKPLTPNALKTTFVRDQIPLSELATIEEYSSPALYRVDQHRALRIVGTPPAGKSTAAAKCVELAEDEIKRRFAGAFVVKYLSAK